MKKRDILPSQQVLSKERFRYLQTIKNEFKIAILTEIGILKKNLIRVTHFDLIKLNRLIITCG